MQNTTHSDTASARLTRGYLVCLVGVVFWSSTAVFIRYLTDAFAMPPLVLAFWRDLFVTGWMTLILGVLRPAWLRVDRRHLLFLAAYGFLLSIFNALWTVSVSLNGAAVATVLAYSSPAYTAVIAWRFFGERLDRWMILAVALSLAGTLLISGAYDSRAWSLNALGVVTGLLSGLGFAGYSLMGKAASHRDLNPWTTLIYTFGFATVFLLIFNLAPGLLPSGEPPNLFVLGRQLDGWLVMAMLALLPSIGGYGLYTFSLTLLPAGVANLIATLEPSLTAVQSYLFLGERFSQEQIVGSLLIIAGMVLLRLADSQRKGELSADPQADR